MTEDEKKHKVFAKKTIKNFDVGEKKCENPSFFLLIREKKPLFFIFNGAFFL